MRRTARLARHRLACGAALAAALLGIAGLAPRSARAEASAPRLASSDPREVELFFDAILAGLMRERRVPGVVVLVLAEGKVLFEKGYGVADLATRRPIDPATTLFRVGSVSKLFTATAAMQLVEEGKLDLHADVNALLADFRLPDAFGKPVTLWHLLTHTPGFDDGYLDSVRPLGTPPEPLGAVLAQILPRRVLPPGEVIAYSNRGLGIVAHLVERAAGRRFDEIVGERVLGPLRMTRTGWHLPDPPPPELATGYDWRAGGFVPMELDAMRNYPAGALFTTAREIARFMQAQLDLGAVAGARDESGAPVRLLREETAREMQRTQFRHHPDLPGWALGFQEREWNGVRVVGHGGSWRGYGTELLLVPDGNVGLFVSSTRSYDPRFFDALLDAFFDRFLSQAAPRPALAAPPEAAARAGDYAGTYLPVRRIRDDFMKVADVLSQVSVRENGDGTLTFVPRPERRDPARLVPLAPDLFAVEGRDERVSFRRDAAGRVDQLRLGAFAADRVPLLARPNLQVAVALACVVLFAGTVLGLPLATASRRLFGGPASGVPPLVRAAAWAFSLLALAALVGIAASLATVDPFRLMGGLPGWIRGLFALPLVAIPFALVLPPALARSFASRAWTPLERLHVAFLCLGALAFFALCWSWNLLGVPR